MDDPRHLDPLRFLAPALAAEIRAAAAEVDTTLFATTRDLGLSERIEWSHGRAATLDRLRRADDPR
jgi:hypothetical protein